MDGKDRVFESKPKPRSKSTTPRRRFPVFVDEFNKAVAFNVLLIWRRISTVLRQLRVDSKFSDSHKDGPAACRARGLWPTAHEPF
jgi:hypothetical protein